MYILTDGKNYVMDDPIHPGRVMYSTSPVNAKKFTFKQARALLNNKSKKLSWIRNFNMVDDSSGEEVAEQEVRSRSNKGVFVGKNDIDFDISILDQIMQETTNLLGVAGWNMAQLTTYQNMLSTALSKYDSAEADIEHALQTYKEESGGKKPQAHKMAKVGYLLDDVRDKHKRIKQCQCYIKVMQDAITYHYTLEKHNTTSTGVERAIRHAIENAWSKKEINSIENTFEYTCCKRNGKPTNSEFIALIADKVRFDKN